MPEITDGADRVLLGKSRASAPVTPVPRASARRPRPKAQADLDAIREKAPAKTAPTGPKSPTDLVRDSALLGSGMSSLGAVGFGGLFGRGAEEDVAPQKSVDEALADAKSALEINESLMNLEDQLDERSAADVAALREEAAVMLSEAENQLLQAQDKLKVQDLLFDQQLDMSGLADEVAIGTLADAIKSQGGLSGQTFKAIQDIANNAALSLAEKDEAIDLVMTRAAFSDEITRTVTDLTANVQQLQEFEARDDLDLLGDAAHFFNPTIPFDVVGIDDQDRFLGNLVEDLRRDIGGIVETLPDDDPYLPAYYGLLDVVSRQGPDADGVDQTIRLLSEQWGVPFNTIKDAMVRAHAKAEWSQQQWDMAADADSLTPGSEAMIAAIYQAGEEIGMEPEFLELVAKSRDLHMLIDTKSKGRSGQQIAGGTIAGVGGLTEDMYEAIMGEKWNPRRGMKWELQALLAYLEAQHGSDPIAAVDFWRQTGEWGGTGVNLSG